ncbi:Universal stress proteinc/MT2699 [Mycobacterium basiliense]|uniref:Universal stress proteinc/MT2699 n=1 Tax=Mycobacterium basiliense TaxID=2094119 RepID=A0A3S5CZW6_9MYCO|nr:universal stress protein [Mycobacterium basiliense]VDM89524.1 Universal stress proteinc/MT2699 [Mycobacterium basiliense]
MNQLDAKWVVVGVNGAPASITAAQWAIDEAVGRQLSLRLVYVIPRGAQRVGSESPSEWDFERGERVLSQAVGAVHSAAQSEGKPVEIETAMLSGDPDQVLIDESQNAALICVGTAKRGRGADGVLGPTAAALVKHARCPVAIIRTHPDGSPIEIGLIAVVLNDEADNDEVVHVAMEEGRRRHATVRQIDRRINSWVRRYPDVPVQIVASGTGAREVERDSSAIDLAVVGASEADELPGLVTPNCHPILGYPDCSVLLVRH